jgi:hypothetical protein
MDALTIKITTIFLESYSINASTIATAGILSKSTSRRFPEWIQEIPVDK